MAKITFIDASGQSRTVEAQVGATVMETALRNSVPGIEAECGGAFRRSEAEQRVDGIDASPPGLPPADALELAQLLERVDSHVRVGADAERDAAMFDPCHG